jgi:hypothetical protein
MAVAISIVVARLFSPRAMIAVALCWTAFTFLAAWMQWLVLLQLVTVWGTVWFLSKLFGRPARDDGKGIARGVTDASAPSTSSTAAIVGPNSGLNEFAETAERVAKGLEQAASRFGSSVDAQLEKQRANSELRGQLFSLQLSTESAPKFGEFQLRLAKELERPGFAEQYRKYTELFPISNEKRSLNGLTLSPQAPIGTGDRGTTQLAKGGAPSARSGKPSDQARCYGCWQQ